MPWRVAGPAKPLDGAHLRVVLALGGIRRWKSANYLSRGAPMSTFFKIRSGVVTVSRTLDDGRRHIVAVRAPGDCVGYLDDDGKYAFNGAALTDVEACAFDRRGSMPSRPSIQTSPQRLPRPCPPP